MFCQYDSNISAGDINKNTKAQGEVTIYYRNNCFWFQEKGNIIVKGKITDMYKIYMKKVLYICTDWMSIATLRNENWCDLSILDEYCCKKNILWCFQCNFVHVCDEDKLCIFINRWLLNNNTDLCGNWCMSVCDNQEWFRTRIVHASICQGTFKIFSVSKRNFLSIFSVKKYFLFCYSTFIH